VAKLSYIGTRTGTHVSQVTGVSDVQIGYVSGDHYAYVTSQAHGLITVYKIGSSGGFNYVDQEVFSSQGTPYGFEFLEIDGVKKALPLGTSTSTFSTLNMNSNGFFSQDNSFTASVANNGSFQAATHLELTSGHYVYAVQSNGIGIELYKLDASGNLQIHPANVLNIEEQTLSVGALKTVTIGNQNYLFATSLTEQEITVYFVKPNGVPQKLTAFGVDQNLGVAEPTHLEHVQIAGVDFLVMGSSGSSSITIFKVLDGGHLIVTDHVFDELNTRFQKLPEMHVIDVAGRAMVVAGGADDGLTLLELLPDGTLIHHDTIADQMYSSLDGVSGLSAFVDGTTVHVYAAGQSDIGVSHFSFSLGTIGAIETGGFASDQITGTAGRDILTGNNGDDIISGLGGNDILVDGKGQDILTGGAGADRFVLSSDNHHDIITDFQVGIDTLDLSNYQLFRNMGQLNVVSHVDGATVTFFGESLRIFTLDGQSLDFQDFVDVAPISLTHMTIGLTPQDLILEGGAEADALIGGLGNDTLSGLDGNDVLSGSGGADILQGGDGEDCADYSAAVLGVTVDMQNMNANAGEAAGDIFYSIEHLLGSNHQDRLLGNSADNHIMGEIGRDMLLGRRGNDLIEGGNGNDTLKGNSGRDVLKGGNGKDTIQGNNGRDILNGGGNDDVLIGGKGNDVYLGGKGSDTFVFELNSDKIHDFHDDEDQILIAQHRVGNGITTGQDIVQTYGTIEDGNAILNFGSGHILTILNVSDLGVLHDDIALM